MQIMNMFLDITLGTLCLNVSLYWHVFLLTLIVTFHNLIGKFKYFGIMQTLQKIQRTKQNYGVSSNNMYRSIFLSIIQEVSNFHANLKISELKMSLRKRDHPVFVMSAVPDRQSVARLTQGDSLCTPGSYVRSNMESVLRTRPETTTYRVGQKGKSSPGESWPGAVPSLSWIWPVLDFLLFLVGLPSLSYGFLLPSPLLLAWCLHRFTSLQLSSRQQIWRKYLNSYG